LCVKSNILDYIWLNRHFTMLNIRSYIDRINVHRVQWNSVIIIHTVWRQYWCRRRLADRTASCTDATWVVASQAIYPTRRSDRRASAWESRIWSTQSAWVVITRQLHIHDWLTAELVGRSVAWLTAHARDQQNVGPPTNTMLFDHHSLATYQTQRHVSYISPFRDLFIRYCLYCLKVFYFIVLSLCIYDTFN